MPRWATLQKPWFVWTLVLGSVSAWLTVHPEHESDPFWHFMLGREVLRHKARTVPEPTAFLSYERPCVVPEWLWDVCVYGLYEVGSYPLLVALLIVIAFAVAWALVALARMHAGDRAPSVVLTGTALMLTLSSARLRLRPQVACLLLLPAFIYLSYRFRDATGRQRILLAAGLVAMELVWAQLHGSFVLAPVVFVLVNATSIKEPSARRASLIVLLLLSLGLMSSAHGLGIADYILSHRGTYATRHISDMMPPTWAAFDPTEQFFGPVYALTWLVMLASSLRARRFYPTEWALAALSLVLGFGSIRFLAEGAALLLPLYCRAGRDAEWLPSQRRAGAVLAAGLSLTLLLLAVQRMDRNRGPLGSIGLAVGKHPRGAAWYLRGIARGRNVLSDYDAGGSLGFWLDGAARTFVDSRTPMYFDDTDYLVARTVWSHPAALRRALLRYDIFAVVTSRHSPTCAALGPEWQAVVVEPVYTTFVRRGSAAPLQEIAPCGRSYLVPGRCAAGDQRRADIARLRKVVDRSFVDFLEVAHAVECEPLSPAVTAKLPTHDQARQYAGARAEVLARYELRAGRPARALDMLADMIAAGDLSGLRLLAPSMFEGKIPFATARDVLERAERNLDERTPAFMHAMLAMMCAQEADAECARHHGIAAAVAGEPLARPTLDWLVKFHTSEAVREDAKAWAQVLDER